jgi:hypothetical protein
MHHVAGLRAELILCIEMLVKALFVDRSRAALTL